MELKSYMGGKGIDVSEKSEQPSAAHFFVEPDNFYSLREGYKFESLDFIYSKNLINKTKFHRILLKEWFNFCKVRGKIIIQFVPDNLLNFTQLKEECLNLFGDKIKFIAEDEGKESALVIEKSKPTLRKGDSINSWSFGILTDGRREEVVDKEIASILALKIPHLEIIICGPYKNIKKYKINHIDFQPEIAWITKKKNMIAARAKYENLVITHDRFIFNPDWFDGMKKYGNYFDILSCVITNSAGGRADDWLTYATDLNDPLLLGNQGLLDYRDWDKNGYLDGGIYIMKKSLVEKIKWNNKLLWSQGEDIELSRDIYNAGFVARFNKFSSCKTVSTKKYNLPIYEFSSRKLGSIRNQKMLARVGFVLKIILRKNYLAIRDAWKSFKKYYK